MMLISTILLFVISHYATEAVLSLLIIDAVIFSTKVA